MCVRIANNFTIRNNIIAAILTTVPLPLSNNKNELKGSFTYERLSSLIKGKFCLPPYFSEIDELEDDKRIEKVLNYINMPSDSECKDNNGYLLKLSKDKINELFGDDILGVKYIEYTQQINKIYMSSLIGLDKILDELNNNINITINDLNEISKNVKYIIDELYLKTQFYYLLCILILLDFDFMKSKQHKIKKNTRIKKLIDGNLS